MNNLLVATKSLNTNEIHHKFNASRHYFRWFCIQCTLTSSNIKEETSASNQIYLYRTLLLFAQLYVGR